MEINLQETLQSLGDIHPKARHLSQVSGGWGRAGVGGWVVSAAPSWTKVAGFLMEFMGLLAQKGGAGVVMAENHERGANEGAGNAWSPWLRHEAAPGKQGD